MRPMLSACRSCPNIVCRRFARSLSLRREIVKHEASVNAAPNPKIVCADFVGSTVTSAAAVLLATFVHAISSPAASRFPPLSVTSVCAGFVGACAPLASALVFSVTPNTEAATAPTPSPAYFKTSRRVFTLGSRVFLNYSRCVHQGGMGRRRAYCKTYYLGHSAKLGKSGGLNGSTQHQLEVYSLESVGICLTPGLKLHDVRGKKGVWNEVNGRPR